MSHDERELASAYVLDALDAADRERFEAHLAGCAECQAEVRSFRPVVDALARMADAGQPSPELRARVLDTRGVRVVRPHVLPGPGASRAFRPAIVVPWFLATAAALALAVLTPYTVQLRNRTRQLAVAVRDLTARLAETDRQLVAVRNDVSLLASPDVKRVDLRGQGAVPQAAARAYFSRSRGVYFIATDLPPVSTDRAYQLWFVTPGGPVNAQVFTPDGRGGAELIAAVPPGMPDPTVLAVTLEPAGGSTQPTTVPFLVGTVN
jgi:anti-sigma-K factor RskA